MIIPIVVRVRVKIRVRAMVRTRVRVTITVTVTVRVRLRVRVRVKPPTVLVHIQAPDDGLCHEGVHPATLLDLVDVDQPHLLSFP